MPRSFEIDESGIGHKTCQPFIENGGAGERRHLQVIYAPRQGIRATSDEYDVPSSRSSRLRQCAMLGTWILGRLRERTPWSWPWTK